MTKKLVALAPTLHTPTAVAVLRDIALHETTHTLAHRGAMHAATSKIARKHGAQATPMEVEQAVRAKELSDQQARACEQGRADGYRQGHEEGFREGLRLGQQKSEQMAQAEVKRARDQALERLRRLDELLQGVPDQVSRRVAAAEDDMVALCFGAVCRIAGEQLASVAGVRQHLLHSLRDWHSRAALAVHLHPDDLQLLQSSDRATEATPGTTESSAVGAMDHDLQHLGHQKVQWVADPTIDIGGCVLRSSEGGLDARLQTQMDSLRLLLLEVRAQRRTQIRAPRPGSSIPAMADRADPQTAHRAMAGSSV